MIRLEEMSDSDFVEFCRYSSEEYAQANVESGRWGAEGALERAERELQALLPDGTKTPDKWVFNIVELATDKKAGFVFFAAVEEAGLRGGYIYDLEIYSPFRRQGYAKAALDTLDKFAIDLQLPYIGLHVFGSNNEARNLYDLQGYKVQSMQMRKTLPSSQSAR